MPEVRGATPYYKPGSNRTSRTPAYYVHTTEQWLVFPHELQGLTVQEIAENKPEMAGLLPDLRDAIETARASQDDEA